MSASDAFYARLPVWAQHTALTVYGVYWHYLRFGPGFKHYVQEYKESEVFSKKQWQDLQTVQLRRLLEDCIKYVPYYRENWTEDQKRAALNGNLRALPLLEKSPLRHSPRSFLREDLHPFHPQIFFTSGSTGTPISSYYTIPELRRSIALREVRSVGWADVSFSMPRATFSGRLVEPDPQSQGPFYRYNAWEKQVYFSAFHLRPDTAHQYVEALKRHKIEWATGYAVSYYLLARFILEKNIPPPELKAIITTSEKLTSNMRSVMEQAYRCRIYEEYSTVENAIFASECEHGRLHISPDVAVVEILRPDGSSCEADEPGEVVVTTLSRTYQPLIRFRLGDVAAWDSQPCPCGREMPVIKEVLGRVEDVIVGPDGRQMVRFHGVFVNQPHILEGQIIQESLIFIRVKVVPIKGFDEQDVRDIVHRVQQRLSETVKVEVETVSEIPRTKAGKFQAVISNIKNKIE
ncbi:MAG: phenylacetate--CoA ligase family protein [Anaerolineales bacterium]|nr:phenylacetate--CoA ligase family protein [Anaerolineales bacterium]